MAQIAQPALQQSFWNSWNEHYGKGVLDSATRRQAEIVGQWLESLGRTDLDILEIGCGSGWLCPQLTRFGHVIGTDLSDQGLERAKQRALEATFVHGDFMDLDFNANAFDVVVALEVLSHMPDQKAFIAKLAGHLRPGGYLMLATQNRFVLQYLNRRPAPGPGQVRCWVDRRELRALLEPHFEVSELFSVTPRIARDTMVRLRDAARRMRRVAAAAGNKADRAAGNGAGHTGLAARSRRWACERLEAMWLGWTLMALARKRGAAV